jgi:hypothetical protein
MLLCEIEVDHSHENHACLYVRRLLSGMPSDERCKRRFAVLQLWLDDSGKGQLPAFVLAGYCASVDAWIAFADEWQTELRRPPALAYLKGKEAFGLFGQFRGWSETERDSRLLRFVALIKKHSNRGLGIAIGHHNFERILKQPLSPYKTPYTFLYMLSLNIVLGVAANANEKIEVIFDRDVIKRKQAEDAYKRWLRILPEEDKQLLGREEPRFEDDMHFMPLQAADVLAWYVRARASLPDAKYEATLKSPVFAALNQIPTPVIPITDGQMRELLSRVAAGRSRGGANV